MKIPLVDLSAQYKNIYKDIDDAIREVIKKTDFIMGEEVEKFEEAFASFLKVDYAVGVSSGTDALHLALKVLGIGYRDEVILPSHTFTATAEVIVWLGAKPVFVDIDEKTYNIDPEKIKKAITLKTKAIIPVHLYGQPADINSILQITNNRKRKIYTIEDCAQAHGAEIKTNNDKWRKVGTIGDMGCFSFYPGKNLGAYGDAGMIVTNNKEIADRIRLLRNHGRTEKYIHEIVGYGNRLDTIQSAILLAKLKYLKKWNSQRRKHAKLYTKLLSNLKEVVVPYQSLWSKSIYHLYVIRVKNRDKLRDYLQEKGIETGIHYPLPLHLQPAFRFLGYKKGDLPNTEKIAQEIISLPIYPEITDKEIHYIYQCIKKFCSFS